MGGRACHFSRDGLATAGFLRGSPLSRKKVSLDYCFLAGIA
jgi:hypothetical protein